MNRLDALVTPWFTQAANRIAVFGDDEALSYSALDELANRFARMFREHGVKAGDRVGIHLPRCGRAVAAMLGALRIGAVYVPLDPGSPPARMKLITADCDLRHVVIAPHLLDSWLAAGVEAPVEHFFLSSDARPASRVPSTARVHPWSAIAATSAASVDAIHGSLDDLAYILYTSGSTGVPKGVMLSHRNAVAFVDWAARTIDLHADDRVASVAPFHFDLSVFDVWSSLSRGATVVIVDEATVLSGPRMLERIRTQHITVWYSVPSALVLMLENGRLTEIGAPSLRVVFFAGEVFPIRHLASVMAALPHARFFNLFGPTETNVCTAYEVPAMPALDAAAIPIGTAACGDECFVLSPDRQPVKDGEIGELFVEGPTVMLGYWDGGRRTPAAHPYSTGDLVSRRADGELMYHGRRDHLVKVRGFRVELGEVEAVVHRHAKIKESIAMAVDQQLIVVAVPADRTISVLDLKQHCAAHLPRYMVPSGVKLVEQLPRTSSGKIDRVKTRTAVIEGDVTLLKTAGREGE
jgi:amino acid adenylation domain-containing protein